MAKHIAPPATAEQIMRALGVTQEDMEFIDRVLKEVDEEEGLDSLSARTRFKRNHPIDAAPSPPPDSQLDPPPPPYRRPEEDDSMKAKKETKS